VARGGCRLVLKATGQHSMKAAARPEPKLSGRPKMVPVAMVCAAAGGKLAPMKAAG
jgi:hypothetical protein